jgi:hypothetical protein
MSDNQLEEDFIKLMDDVGEQINAHMQQALKSLKAATDLADQYGLPFYAAVSGLGQSYIPYSFGTQWGALDKELVASYTEVHPDDLAERYTTGWQLSEIC